MSLILSKSDRDSQVFRKLMQHYADRLQALRTQNDGDVTLEQTAKLRGQIFEIKAFLYLDKDQPVVEDRYTWTGINQA